MALSKALNTDMSSVANMLRSMGRGKDSILAHITPEEARLLKARGGRGSINPATGLPEFDVESVTVTAPSTDYGTYMYDPTIVSPSAPSPAPAPAPSALPTEQVESTGTRAPSTDAGTFMYDPGIIQAPAPQPVVAQTLAPAPAAPQPLTAAQAATIPQESVVVSPERAATAAMPDYASFMAPDTVQTPTQEPSLDKQAKSFLGNNSTLLSILGLGGMGLLGSSNLGGGQGAQLQSQLASLAQPTQALGNATLATTMAGGLTPQNAQVLQATEAQIAASQARGAVSSAQAAEAISQTYAGLLQNQLTTAISLLNTADSYLQQAYVQGYNANVANQTATSNFYSTMAQLAARLGGIGGGGTTINLPAGSTVSGN